jgi:hypothetical protein
MLPRRGKTSNRWILFLAGFFRGGRLAAAFFFGDLRLLRHGEISIFFFGPPNSDGANLLVF